MSDALMDDSGTALAIGSANLDHLHYFGNGRPLEGYLGPKTNSGLQWMTLLDGFPLAQRANHITGEHWPRLPGSDLIYPILSLASSGRHRVGFFGGSPENHARLAKVLPALYPNLQIAGFWAPSRAEVLSPESSSELARQVRAQGVDILFVALGKPRQERWINDFGVQSGAKVLLAFGAATDFITGQSQRAPRWMQDTGLEWAHRLSNEPKRLSKRYLIDGPGAARMLLDKNNATTYHPDLGQRSGRHIRSVGCVIVTYNSGDHVRALVESIPPAADGLDVRIVVVDNNSQDNTLDVLAEFPEITVIHSGGNLGYAAGVNLGLPHVSDTDAVAILNPDLTLAPGSLSALVNALGDWHVGVAVPLIKTPSGHRYDSLRREPTIMGAVGEAVFGARFPRRPLRLSDTLRRTQHYAQVRDVDWASGAAWLVARDCLTDVGAWNESYFLYSEETEYARRVRRVGYRIRFVPSAQVFHAEHGSGQSPKLAMLLAVNRVRDYEAAHTRGRSVLFRFVIVLHHALRASRSSDRRILRQLLAPRPNELPGPTRN